MNIVIIDDDALVTTALKTILEADPHVTVTGTGSDGREALPLYRSLRPDVLLMDIRMEGMSGLEASKAVLAEDPEARILLLTTFSDDEYIVKALKLGAKGYLLKQDYKNIIPAVRAVYSGQTVFGETIVSRIPELIGSRNSSPSPESFGLSGREFDIVRLVAEGLSNREIASHLYLSEGTVRNYLSGILNKLDLRDRTQVAVFYYQNTGR